MGIDAAREGDLYAAGRRGTAGTTSSFTQIGSVFDVFDQLSEQPENIPVFAHHSLGDLHRTREVGIGRVGEFDRIRRLDDRKNVASGVQVGF